MSDWYIDYSKRTLSASAILSSRVGRGGEAPRGCIRYTDSPQNWSGKHTNRQEYQDHIANGLDDKLVIERTVNDCLGGFNGGVKLAQAGVDGAEAIGYSDHLFVTCDRHFVQPQSGPIISAQIWQDFLGGAESVIGMDRLGAYAFSEGIDAANGSATAFWQAGSESQIRPWTNLWQDNNWRGMIEDVEVDRSLQLKQFGVKKLDDNDVIKLTTLAGNYSETHRRLDVTSWEFYWTSDTYKMVTAMQSQLVEIAAAVHGDIDAEALAQRLEAANRQAVFDAINSLAVPALIATMRDTITAGTIAEDVANEVVHAFAQRLDAPPKTP